MSMNSDGMDQFKTRLPHNVGDDVVKINQHLQGVIEHGQEFVIYRTYDNIRKDACLGIHCFLLQLETRMERDAKLGRKFPETLYFQMDGGSENSNKTTLLIMSLLVAHRVFKTVLMTRIMRGH